MKRKILFIFILFLNAGLLTAQDIKQLFKVLPVSYLADDITTKAKDSLLKGKDFHPANNDTDIAVVYKIETIDLKRNYLRILMYYTTGQAAYQIFELRSFKTTKGKTVVILSKLGGAHHIYWPGETRIFNYSKEKGFAETTAYGLPKEADITEFLKPETPAPITEQQQKKYSIRYELGQPGNKIRLILSSDIHGENPDKNLFLGNAVDFVWSGDRFVKQKPIFTE